MMHGQRNIIFRMLACIGKERNFAVFQLDLLHTWLSTV